MSASTSRRAADAAPKLLVVVATILGVVSMFAVWVRVQALDTDDWVRLSDEILADPEVTDALATFVVDQLYEQIDVGDEFGEKLPDALAGLSDTVAAAVRAPLTDAVERILASEQFASTWSDVNRAAHSTFVDVLRGDTPSAVGVDEGVVTLELRGLLVRAGEQVGLSEQRLEALPADAGSITIFRSDELSKAQQAVQVLDILSWVLFVVVVLLYGSAVALSRGRRLESVRSIGISLLGAGLFVLLVRALAVRLLVPSIVEDPGNGPVADVIADTFTALIAEMAWSVMVWGALIVAFTMLLSPHRLAATVRRRIAPVVTARPAAVAGGTILLVLTLLWWNPGGSFDRLVSGLIVTSLVVAGVVTARRHVIAENRIGNGTPDSVPGEQEPEPAVPS